MQSALDFEDYLLGQGFADRTVTEYAKWARRLARWAERHDLNTAQLQPHHIRRWVDETVPPSRESRKQAHAAVRHLYTMLGHDGQPWTAIRVPRKRPGRPHPLTEPERRRLLDVAQLHGGPPGVAVVGLLQTAARASEACMWRWDGIGEDRLRFWRPKTRDWHEVPLRPLLASMLDEVKPAWVEGFIFPGSRGRQWVSYQALYDWVRHIADLAEVPKVSPHRLRATAISRVLESTGSIDIAAELAGHLDPSVTRNYYAATSWARLAEGTVALD